MLQRILCQLLSTLSVITKNKINRKWNCNLKDKDLTKNIKNIKNNSVTYKRQLSFSKNQIHWMNKINNFWNLRKRNNSNILQFLGLWKKETYLMWYKAKNKKEEKIDSDKPDKNISTDIGEICLINMIKIKKKILLIKVKIRLIFM